MSTLSPTIPSPVRQIDTIADLLHRLGDIPAERVLLNPLPTKAIEADAIHANEKLKRLCELIDGTLVEKAMGLYESLLAAVIIGFLRAFVSPRKLGIVAGSEGMYRVAKGQIRLPDVSFVSWERAPADLRALAAPHLSPDLAVEILSPSNTDKEIQRKRREYFDGGTQLIWIIDPQTRTVSVHIPDQDQPTILTEDQIVDGGDVLPGFSFSIRTMFAEVERPAQ